MPHSIISTDSYTEISVGGRVGRINHADLGSGGEAKLALVMKDLLQGQIDVRIPLADLPDDEPTKTTNPDSPSFFWGDSNGVVQANPNRNDTLISRDTIVTAVVWDGTVYVVYQIRARAQ